MLGEATHRLSYSIVLPFQRYIHYYMPTHAITIASPLVIINLIYIALVGTGSYITYIYYNTIPSLYHEDITTKTHTCIYTMLGEATHRLSYSIVLPFQRYIHYYMPTHTITIASPLVIINLI